jgi:N-acetylmuramoyl-L-alanine amidase
MGATPNSANLELQRRLPGSNGNGARRPAYAPPDYAPGREALQALLAFSALHEQIRRRKFHPTQSPTQSDESPTGETWAADEFVLDDVLQLVSERALAITGADGVALALAEGDQIRCRAAAGTLGPDPGARLDPSSGFSGACYRTGLIVRCDDTERDPRVDKEVCRRMGLRSIVAVPLLTEQGVIGLLEGFCSEAYGFNDSDVRSLSLLAELVLAALRPPEDLPREINSAPDAFETIQRIEAGGSRRSTTAVQPREPKTIEVAEADLPNFQALRDALAPITEDSSTVTENSDKLAEPSLPQYIFAQYTEAEIAPKSEKKRGVVVWLLVLLVLALAGAGALWWRTHRYVPANLERAMPQTKPSGPAADQAVAPAPAAPVTRTAQQSEITGIRHWSSGDSSTVAIDLDDQVPYEAHRLTDPERIYFDLHDTSLAAGVPANVEVGDELLLRIRLAQPVPGVTRVVMETQNSPSFSVSLEPNPYRLVVEIRKGGAKPKNASEINLFAPMHRELAGQVAMNRQAAKGGTTVVARARQWLAPPAADPVQRGHAPKFRLVLDAGHGGWDMGTVGRKGLLEKDLVLDIVARLGNLVADRLGGEVIYTRHNDTYISLESRTDLANHSQADMFLSVHANYSDYPSARGVETYYTNTFSSVHAKQPGAQETNVKWADVDIREKAQGSRRFADEVQRELYRALAAKDHALRNRGVREASYVVLTGTTMPAILAEVSFVSSPTDEMSLQSASYRQRIAEALYKGVAAYAASLHRMNLASTTPRPSGQ